MFDHLLVSSPLGFEKALYQELATLDLSPKLEGTIVSIPFSWEAVFKVNYLSRIAQRVFLPLKKFYCRNKEDLYHQSFLFPWEDLLTAETTIAIDTTVSHSAFTHSLYPGLVVKDAICDRMREKKGERPSVKVQSPDIQLHLLLTNQGATISFDTSGDVLAKRGYKTEASKAPLSENIAAALLYQLYPSVSDVCVDPFCGSGTLIAEAAMMMSNTPPGFKRQTWGFFKHPEFPKEAWEEFRKEQDSKIISLKKGSLFAYDLDPRTIDIAKKHLETLGLEKAVEWGVQDLFRTTSWKASLLFANPPLGKRVSIPASLFHHLGKVIRTCAESAPMRGFILCPSEREVHQLKLPLVSKQKLYLGGMIVEACYFGLDDSKNLRLEK